MCPAADAIVCRNFCFACHAVLRIAGVIDPAVTLPPEFGPMGYRVSPTRTCTCCGGMPNSSATTCARIVFVPPPMILHCGEHLHRAILRDPHLARRVHVDEPIPHRLRNAHAALDRSRVRAGRPAIAPVGLLPDDLPLHLARRALIDLLAQIQRIHVQLDRKIIDRLLECKTTLRMSRRAKRRAWTRIDEDVILFGMNVGALVKIRRRAGRPRARAHPRSSIADQFNRRQRAIALRTDAQLLV